MLPDLPPAPRTRRKALAVLVGVFLAGAAAGAGASSAWRAHAWRKASTQGFGADWTQRLYGRTLGLSDEQRQKLRPAFERHSRAFLALNRKALPEHRALNSELDAEILPVLSTEQLEKFQKMQEGREKFLRGWAGESPDVTPRP